MFCAQNPEQDGNRCGGLVGPGSVISSFSCSRLPMEPRSGPTYLLWTGERLKDCESTAWEETSSDLIVEALKRACCETLGRTEIVMQLWLASLPVHERYEV